MENPNCGKKEMDEAYQKLGEELDHARWEILALEETSKGNATAKFKLQSGLDESRA